MPPFTPHFPVRIFCLSFVWLFATLWFSGCSQEKRTWTSLAWHNTLAHYNGYFIAREKLKEYEATQLAAYKDNYNRILEIYPFPALGSGAAANAVMDEIIKKASIPIQRHKNSDWIDDCYQLVGKARFYKEDWENAIQTFKYINTKFTDVDSKHQAVIWLLITYTRQADFANAKSVIAYLKKEKLSKANLREGALAFSFYYLKRKEYEKSGNYLQMALELMPRGKRKGRLSYVMGQIHQKYKRDPDAYLAYKEVLKNQPSFELEFYTKLNMAQVVAIADERQLRKIRKNFKRMTTDLKYEEYLDKVYYEMGNFEVKQNNMPKGLEYLRTSLQKSKDPKGQKPYTYMRLAELHYNPLRSYVWAKLYYDSTMLGLDTADDNYKFVARRQKILGEFVTHYLTVQKEDSLQKLAQMDTTQLFAVIDRKIVEAQQKQEKADRLARNAARDAANGGGDAGQNSAFDNLGGGPGGAAANNTTVGGTWYFYNLQAVGAGRLDFKRKWGNRKLEDNWRRSSKESQMDDGTPVPDSSKTDAKDLAKGNDKNAGQSDSKDGQGKNSEKMPEKLSQKQLRDPYLKDIPFKPEQLQVSHDKIMLALFEMGKIYDQKLEEPLLAIEALERDVKDYPKFEKRPEALYNLCLIYRKLSKQSDFDRCKDLLLRDHPESVFAKLIVNPNYLVENKQRNEIISSLYRTVYGQYKTSQFIEASNGIASINQQYPKSDYEDKLAILSALITAKTVDINSYKGALRKFIEEYPKSNLQSFAAECLKNAERGTGAVGSAPPPDSISTATSKPKAPAFNEDLNKKHFFIALIPSIDIPEAELTAAFSDFNTKFYPSDGLQVTTLPLGDNKHVMLKVQELPSKIQSMYYLKKVEEAGPFKKEFKNLKPKLLLITQENLIVLYNTKAVIEYGAFYEKNYDLAKTLDDDIPDFGK